jgi:hypothetical protein
MAHRETAFSAKPLQKKGFHDKESAASLLETKNQPASYREFPRTPSLSAARCIKEARERAGAELDPGTCLGLPATVEATRVVTSSSVIC